MDGSEIKALRLRLGMTQSQLARKLGCDVSTISKAEADNTRKLHPLFQRTLNRLNKIGGSNEIRS